ncbi:MAG: NfeD family protein [Gallionella sp.]|nr:NfeD family protein [Gallionella sp.]
MEMHWAWWLAAVLLVIAEMFSGTFYLLAVALGLVAAGVAAFLGIGWGGQTLAAALLCSASVMAVYRWKQKGLPKHKHEHANLANEIGQPVHVVHWLDERHARVSYRGAEWDAELADKVPTDETRTIWRIRDIVGIRLIIE